MNGPPTDAWDSVGPNIAFQNVEEENEGVVVDRLMTLEDRTTNIDLDTNDRQHIDLFIKEADKALITSEEYTSMTLSLNKQQKDFIQFHIKWCSDMVNCLENKTSVLQYHVFLSWPGGVGKSHIIKLVHYETMTHLRQMLGYLTI